MTGPATPTIQDAIATLRRAIGNNPIIDDALARVEDEIARLAELADDLSSTLYDIENNPSSYWYYRATAAEDEVARLKDGLRRARKAMEVIEEPMHFDDLDAIADDRLRMQAAARAWLAQDRALLEHGYGGAA